MTGSGQNGPLKVEIGAKMEKLMLVLMNVVQDEMVKMTR